MPKVYDLSVTFAANPGPRIPENNDILVTTNAVWSHMAAQLLAMVAAAFQNQIFRDMQQMPELTPFLRLAEEVWGRHYTQAQVAPLFAIWLIDVFKEYNTRQIKLNILSERFVQTAIDMTNWDEFHVTGEFRRPQGMAELMHVRFRMEDDQIPLLTSSSI